MSSFLKIEGEIIVHQNRASDRCDTDGSTSNAKFIDYFRHQPMSHTVGAARAVVGHRFGKGFGSLKSLSHYSYSF
jgi:hypothetical protein